MAKAQEFEKVLDQSDVSVVSFDDAHKSALKRIQHVLHSALTSIQTKTLAFVVFATCSTLNQRSPNWKFPISSGVQFRSALRLMGIEC